MRKKEGGRRKREKRKKGKKEMGERGRGKKGKKRKEKKEKDEKSVEKNRRNNRFPCLSSSRHFPTRFIRRYVEMMSGEISLSSQNRTLRSLVPISMSAPTEVEASASGSACVSDLSLCDGALEFAGALSSGSGGDVHDVSLHNRGFIVLRIYLSSDVGEVSRASFTNCFSKIRHQ